MRKRLRKKRRVGEFREDCFAIDFQFDANLSNSERDQMIDRFIAMLERHGLQFGGGGIVQWSGVVEFQGRGTATQSDRNLVLDWLEQHPEIVAASAGPLRDAWFGWN